jgi:hypothetical protein
VVDPVLLEHGTKQHLEACEELHRGDILNTRSWHLYMPATCDCGNNCLWPGPLPNPAELCTFGSANCCAKTWVKV